MTDTLASLGNVRARALALLGVIFVAGTLAGIAADRTLLRPSPPSGQPALGRGGPPFGTFGRPGFSGLPPYLEALNLDSAQRSAAMAIVSRVRPRIDSISRLAMPAMQAVTDSARRELEALLTEDQRQQLKNLPTRGGPPFLRRM